MQVLQFKDYHALSDFAAEAILTAIKENPDLILCMASGHTPALTCELLVEKLLADKTDYSRITFLGLDEWVGLPPDNEGSCHYFFKTKLFGPLGLSPAQYYLFDAMAPDLEAECKKMDDRIQQAGGIDMMIVGIGMNGHIGFNEPGTHFTNLSHVASLDEVTKTVGKKYFAKEIPLDKGITIGPAHLLNSKQVLLMANGIKKAQVIKQTIEGPVTESFPASMMQQHEQGFVLIDEEAASLL